MKKSKYESMRAWPLRAGILALGAVNSTVTKVALFAAAVGWAVLAIAGLGIARPGALLTIGILIALINYLTVKWKTR